MYTLGLVSDLLLDKCNQAQRIRMPGQGDVSQIPYLADDRVLVQGPAESNANFIVRLRKSLKTWKRAGSRKAVMGQLQAYLQGLQPGVVASLPGLTIVGGNLTYTTWDTLRTDSPLGAKPARSTHTPINWDWDGKLKPWRAWLILYMSLVPTGQAGSSAAITTSANGSLLGQNVGGVWVPQTSGTPVNHPWLTVNSLAGLNTGNVGQWLTMSGSAHPTNNGVFPITSVLGPTSCVIANPAGVAADAGPLSWSIGAYPFLGPSLPWGAPSIPTIGNGTWGLSGGLQTQQIIISIRQILSRWKSAGTYYPYIMIAFDGGTGAAGSAFSPNSTEGAGNPDGTFGSHGKNVAGVWVPARLVSSVFDCYCDGTGTYNQCSVHNVS